jgi:hypothetical protein
LSRSLKPLATVEFSTYHLSDYHDGPTTLISPCPSSGVTAIAIDRFLSQYLRNRSARTYRRNVSCSCQGEPVALLPLATNYLSLSPLCPHHSYGGTQGKVLALGNCPLGKIAGNSTPSRPRTICSQPPRHCTPYLSQHPSKLERNSAEHRPSIRN